MYYRLMGFKINKYFILFAEHFDDTIYTASISTKGKYFYVGKKYRLQ